MTSRNILLAGLALPLAACGSKPAVNEKNASVEQVSEKVREATGDKGFIAPGKWVSTVTVEQMTMPGLPPEAARQMQKMVAQTHSSESCLTPEEARQPRGKFFGGNDSCRYDRFTMGRGRIDAEMRCSAGGSTQVMKMAGTYSPDRYEMRMKSLTEGTGAGAGVSMQMKVEAKRVGECTGKEA